MTQVAAAAVVAGSAAVGATAAGAAVRQSTLLCAAGDSELRVRQLPRQRPRASANLPLCLEAKTLPTAQQQHLTVLVAAHSADRTTSPLAAPR